MASKADNGDGRRGFPWRILGWGTAALLLLLPLVTNAPWTVSDYIFAATMFGIVGGLLEMAVRKTRNWSYRGAVAVAVASCFLHVWITGAVGIIGNESNPGNLLYLGVVLLTILGSLAALGRAAAMSWAMTAAAVAEALVIPIAYIWVADPASDVLQPEVFVATAFFTGMWLLSAALFRNAARERSSAGTSA